MRSSKPSAPIVVLLLASAVGLALAGSSACKHDDGTTPDPKTPTGPSAGPAEKAGAKVDEGAAEVKDKTKDAAKTTGSAVEKAGEKMKGE